MAKRDGDDNLSPEMQAKMQAAKKLQDELNAKLSQFGQIASNKNMSSVKEYDDLEKELLELKKYAASVKNENDAKLNDMINAMNKKMEKMAKTALEEQRQIAKNYHNLVKDIKDIITKLLKLIDSFDVPSDEKNQMKSTFLQFQMMADAKTKEVETFIAEIEQASKKMDTADKAKLTKEDIGVKIDDLVQKIRANKQISHPGGPGGPAIIIVPVQQAPGGPANNKKQ
ncbi:uncharacterized protein LOC106670106 isoform X4 [Cimex lectularius]|uniref:Uncharacterized protein n=1 Tax=Cimex lectularius TaxID=79782 RepID=A0A8I6S006_CIMLE|nr:uncharacterized protein LOC106670106 isoform X4 [Cimex lectularius]XP_014255625.1 uncharacterized protein LOC106670106 isoform X4 [Cimex lectularius]XP_014255627.1 uncharacterized protein LOC106670106 isoform X4 [Cimex lectularius]